MAKYSMNSALDNAMCRALEICMTTNNFLVKWAADAVAYYINSGRASTPWVKAFCRANTRKLLEYMAAGNDGSDKGLLKRADAYLKKHRLIED